MTHPANWYKKVEENNGRISKIIAEQGKLIKEFIITGDKSLVKKFITLAEEFQGIHKDHQAGTNFDL